MSKMSQIHATLCMVMEKDYNGTPSVEVEHDLIDLADSLHVPHGMIFDMYSKFYNGAGER